MNWFYLLAGLLTLLMSAAHAYWGEKNLVPELNSSNLSDLSKVGFYIPWHQITNVLLLSGLALVMGSFLSSIPGIDILAIFITLIVAGNFLIFIVISLKKYRPIIGQSIPQFIFFSLIILLSILGTVL